MIRFATKEDISCIMDFIDLYWRKNHIMARNRKLFEFQHVWDVEVSFVVSEDAGYFNGVLGFIPYSRNDRDVTLAIWKAVKTKNTMLGVNML